MDDYYSHHPRTRLERPLALVGFCGSGVRAVANGLVALTGLPLNDVERLVEGRAGRSRSRIFFEDGADALRALEVKVTEQAIARLPAGVIALTDSGLLDPDLRERLRAETQLVYLQRPLAFLLEAIRNGRPGAIPEFALSTPARIEDIQPFFAEREPGYLQAEVRFNGESLPARRIVDELIAGLRLLPSSAGAVR